MRVLLGKMGRWMDGVSSLQSRSHVENVGVVPPVRPKHSPSPAPVDATDGVWDDRTKLVKVRRTFRFKAALVLFAREKVRRVGVFGGDVRWLPCSRREAVFCRV